MKYSPILLAVTMVLGIVTADIAGMFYTFLFTAVLLTVFIVRSVLKGQFDLMVLLLSVGFIVSSVSYTVSVDDYFNKLTAFTQKQVELSGTITEPAYESSYDDNYKYTVKVKTVKSSGGEMNINEKIMLTTPELFSCGDDVTINGIIKEIPNQMNDNGADMRLYYKSLGIFRRIYSESVVKTGEEPWYNPKLFGGRVREQVDRLIYHSYSGDGAAVLSAVLTGNKHHFSKEFNDVLDSTAFKRHFHPAFIHMMLVSFLVGLLTPYVKRRSREILILIILVIYAFLGTGVGFTRCIVIAAAAIFFKYKNGKHYYPDTMSWLIIVCCIISPLILFNSGFIISVTAGILIWAFLPFIELHLGWVPEIMRRTWGVIIICTVGLLPLTAYYFNGICIYSIIATFFMIPLTIAILVLSPIVLTANMIFSSTFIGGYLDLLLFIVIKIPYIIKGLPFSNISLASPGSTLILMSGFALFALYYKINGKKFRAVCFCSGAGGFLASTVITLCMSVGTSEFTFVNVGQADGSLIHTAFGETVIIDGGGGADFSEYNVGKSVFVPYIRAKGHNIIEAAFVSHFHKDHVEGVTAAVNSLRVRNVFAPNPQNCSDDMMELVRELENAANENGTKITYISEDTRITFDCGLVFDIYVPNEMQKISRDENDTSLLIKASYGDFSCLYTGDMTSFGEYCHIISGTDVSADVLKVAHHGSRQSTSEEWVNAVNPDFAVISCGEDNMYGHPHKDTLKRLDGIGVLRTDFCGDITFKAKKDGSFKINYFR